jgi:hypothetical protein
MLSRYDRMVTGMEFRSLDESISDCVESLLLRGVATDCGQREAAAEAGFREGD